MKGYHLFCQLLECIKILLNLQLIVPASNVNTCLYILHCTNNIDVKPILHMEISGWNFSENI